MVDPGDAAVMRSLEARHLQLAAILVTRHHGDHVGAADGLRPCLAGPVDGPAREPIPVPFEALRGGDRIEATPQQMPALSNLRCAQAVEPHNRDIVASIAWCEDGRSHGRPTLPSTIDRERSINPFLRCTEPDVAAGAGADGASSREPLAVFAALREWKNQFR